MPQSPAFRAQGPVGAEATDLQIPPSGRKLHRRQERTIGVAKAACGVQAALSRPSKRIALPFKMPGITSGLKPATSKSFIQRSGVING